MSKNTTFKRGFTLIELLVVVAIIGLLASVILANLNTARVKARDAERLSDLHQINLAINEYFNNNGYYPICGVSAEEYIYDGTSDCLSLALIGDKLMSRLPTNPIYATGASPGAWGYDYGYISNSTGSFYNLRGGFEGTPIPRNGNYPGKTDSSYACWSGTYQNCTWEKNCVYTGYGAGTCSETQQFGNYN